MPCGALAKPSTPRSAHAFGATMWTAANSREASGKGVFVLNSTVRSSTAVTVSTIGAMFLPMTVVAPFSDWSHSNVALIAAAFNGSPLVKVTPGRSLNVQVKLPSLDQLLASAGSMTPPSPISVRLS